MRSQNLVMKYYLEHLICRFLKRITLIQKNCGLFLLLFFLSIEFFNVVIYFNSDTNSVFSLIVCSCSFTLLDFEYSGSNLSLSFFIPQGRLRVPQDLCNTTIENDFPIAMVLPSTTGMGVCSTSLTFFLVNANNESLGAYRSATNQDRYIIL